MEEYIIKSKKNKNDMKLYKCYDPIGPGVTVRAPERCCLFCKHCSDVYWDYSHGPYMMICIKHDDVFDCGGAGGTCKDFKEDKDDRYRYNK